MNAVDLMLTTLLGGAAALGGGLLLSATPRLRLATRRALLLAGIVVALLAPAIVLASNGAGFGLRPTNSTAPTSPAAVNARDAVAPRAPNRDAMKPIASDLVPIRNEMPVASLGQNSQGSSTAPTPWADIASFVWATGIAWALARIFTRLVRLRRLRRSLVPSDDPRAPGVFVSASLCVPSAIGILRPVIVLPPGLAGDWSDDDLRAVLRHEQSHVDRKDPLAALVARAAQAFHWPNPLAHIAVARLDALCERLADDAAVGARPEAAPRYASCLVRLAERALGTQAAAGISPIVSRRGRLTRRIDALLAPKSRAIDARSTIAGRVVAVGFGLLAAVGIGCYCPRPERSPRSVTTTAPGGAISGVPGAADSLALRPGDIVRSINGVPVHSRADVINVVRGLPKTTTSVTVVVTRNGQDRTFDVSPFRAESQTSYAGDHGPRSAGPDSQSLEEQWLRLAQSINAATWSAAPPDVARGGAAKASPPRVIQFSPTMSPIDLTTGLANPTFTDNQVLVSTDPAYPGKIVIFFETAAGIDPSSVLEAGKPDRLDLRSVTVLHYIPGTGNVPLAAAPGGVDVLRDRIVFTPATLPLANGQYSIGVFAGVKDRDGNSLDPAPAFHSFTVGSANAVATNLGPTPFNGRPDVAEPRFDTIAPTIVTSSPVNGATGVGAGVAPAQEDGGRRWTTSPDIVIRFNESIAAASITPDTIRVIDDGAFVPGGGAKPSIQPAPGFPKLKAAVDGATLPSNGFEVVWRPDTAAGGFPFATRIEVEVVGSDGGKNTKAIADRAGNALERSFRFQFQTRQPPTPAK